MGMGLRTSLMKPSPLGPCSVDTTNEMWSNLIVTVHTKSTAERRRRTSRIFAEQRPLALPWGITFVLRGAAGSALWFYRYFVCGVLLIDRLAVDVISTLQYVPQ